MLLQLKVSIMKITYHAIISAFVFGFLYLKGVPLDFVLLAFFAAILVDIDHMALGRVFGTYNPIGIYNHCMTREIENVYTPKGMLMRRWFDLRMLPFHNLFLNAFLLIVFLPVGLGMLLHNILDAIDYVTFHVLDLNCGGCRKS